MKSLSERHVVAFRTDIGYSHHVNQDAGWAWTSCRSDGSAVSCVAVADGVSAGRHSEGASRLAVEVIEELLRPALEDPALGVPDVLARLVEAAREADQQVARRPHEGLNNADATTLVATFCLGSAGAGVWCGDSRIYRIRGGNVDRLTRDHSWAEGVVSHGIMSAEDAARDPRAHMITRWLGPPEQEDPGIELVHFELQPGDVILCCSDGLYMYFVPPVSDEAEMGRVLASHGSDLQAGLDELVSIALRRGGRDNVTVAAIKVGAGPSVAEPSRATEETVKLRLRNQSS